MRSSEERVVMRNTHIENPSLYSSSSTEYFRSEWIRVRHLGSGWILEYPSRLRRGRVGTAVQWRKSRRTQTVQWREHELWCWKSQSQALSSSLDPMSGESRQISGAAPPL